ncbi:MAG: RsmF rRNA methyltransferase first C-terminal domain-containing protein [Erysipelotrichaceae bacterium]|nr:RsmF rRNA methyltransferase first C-terminal domain-containing protein [Erysipelotrichaceae bacterium]
MHEDFKVQMKNLLGNEYDDFMSALQDKPIKSIYLNPLKDNIPTHLNQQYLRSHPIVSDAYYYDYDNYELGKSPYFSCGLYYIQEPSALLVGGMLDIKEDDYVLDMCGAPGGKTCYVASHLSNDGLMITNDIVPLRAKILSENVERFSLQNTIVTNSDPKDFIKILPEFFDKIILDAPCSGEGMFRKNNEAIKQWSIDKVNECAYIQRGLIDTAMKLLKPGGQLIYSTCTYNTIENEDQIRYILDHYDCTLLPIPKSHGMSEGIGFKEVVRLYPHKYQGEGQFIALIQKNGTPSSYKYKPMRATISRNNFNLIQDFYNKYLHINMPTHLYDNNNHIYSIQPQFPSLKGIRILRNGLYLGECKKNRFEPSLALALTLNKQDVKQSYVYHVDDVEIKQYLHGECIVGSDQKGYGVLFVDEYPLSFYKESNGQAKNLYPKGLRR